MKNYIKPEIEVLNFQAENIMLENFELLPSSVNGGFDQRD